MDEFSSILTATIGPGAIVTMIVVMITKGALVPRSVLEDVRKDRDARLVEVQAVADMWKKAWEEEAKRASILAEQNRDLLQGARTANTIATATQKAIEKVAS